VLRPRSIGVVLERMQVIGVTSGRPPSVNRPEASPPVFVTFDSLRDAKVHDRETRVTRCKGPQAARLWRLLGAQLTPDERSTD
jgi:hypothetical protein